MLVTVNVIVARLDWVSSLDWRCFCTLTGWLINGQHHWPAPSGDQTYNFLWAGLCPTKDQIHKCLWVVHSNMTWTSKIADSTLIIYEEDARMQSQCEWMSRDLEGWPWRAAASFWRWTLEIKKWRLESPHKKWALSYYCHTLLLSIKHRICKQFKFLIEVEPWYMNGASQNESIINQYIVYLNL